MKSFNQFSSSFVLDAPATWLWVLILTMPLGCMGGGTGSTGDTPDSPIAENSTGLAAFNQCDGLLRYFHEEAIFTLNHFNNVVHPGDPDIALSREGSGASGQANDNGGAQPPMAPGAAPSHSTTNVQERGVDEPDIAKTDGDFIYTSAGGWLLIHDTDGLNEVSRTELVGDDAQLLLEGDTLAIVGRYRGAPEEEFALEINERRNRGTKTVISVYDVRDRANPALVRRSYVEGELLTVRVVQNVLRAVVFYMGGAELEDQLHQHGGGGQSEPPRISQGGGTDPGEPIEVMTESSEDADADDDDEMGAQRSALVVDEDDEHRADDEEERLMEAERIIRGTSIDVWVPYRFEVVGDNHSVERVTSCGQFYRPGERSGLGVTALVTIDLTRPAEIRQDAAVVTGPGVAYTSGTSLYLTTTNHSWWGRNVVARTGVVNVSGTSTGGIPDDQVDESGAAQDANEPGDGDEDDEAFGEKSSPINAAPEQFTQVHRLDISARAGAAQYVGSGRVRGVPLNSFSLSEHAGHLRVATTEQLFDSERDQTNHVSILGALPVDGALPLVGSVGDIADGERVYAARFVGDRGFVVTFKRVDPLFTLDLSDPANPQLVGELKVPGFSTYLHPLASDHLIGIGQSATDEGRVTGMQLSLFDVSNFAEPRLADTHALGDGWSEALYDHHAFTFWSPRDLLMVPVLGFSNEGDRSGLELFSVNPADGFGPLGFIDHAALGEHGRSDSIRRSMVIGESIITIGRRGLLSTDINTLEGRAQAEFPEPRHGGGDNGFDVRRSGGGEPDVPPTPEPVEPAPDQEDAAQ